MRGAVCSVRIHFRNQAPAACSAVGPTGQEPASKRLKGLVFAMPWFFLLAAPFLLCGAPAWQETLAGGTRAKAPSLLLPRSCVERPESSTDISQLLRTLATRPVARIYNELGESYLQRNKLDCAIAAFEAGLRLDSDLWEARYNLALALIQQGKPAKAADELRLVLRQKPDSFLAHNARGLALENLGSLDEAKEGLRPRSREEGAVWTRNLHQS